MSHEESFESAPAHNDTSEAAISALAEKVQSVEELENLMREVDKIDPEIKKRGGFDDVEAMIAYTRDIFDSKFSLLVHMTDRTLPIGNTLNKRITRSFGLRDAFTRLLDEHVAKMRDQKRSRLEELRKHYANVSAFSMADPHPNDAAVLDDAEKKIKALEAELNVTESL